MLTLKQVWGIGGIIVALMNREPFLPGVEAADFAKGEARPRILAEAEENYSLELRALVGECTAYWPDQRPGLRELLQRIRAHTGARDEEEVVVVVVGEDESVQEDLARGMRHKTDDEVEEELRLKWPSNHPAAINGLVRQALEELRGRS
jgi:hypothetical protein